MFYTTAMVRYVQALLISCLLCPVSFGGYGDVALPFEPSSSGYRYIARDKNFAIGVSEHETVFVAKGARLRMRFVEGHAKALEALARLPGHSNYIYGRDEKKWRTNVPQYGKIRYRDVWNEIDLIFYGTRGRAEYDFVVKPGADPGRIAFTLDGAEKIWIGKEGDLHLQVAGGELTHRKPAVYQQRADGRREAVEGRYVLAGRTVRFAVGSYDRTRALTIDPVLHFATYLGGSQSEQGTAIAVDAAGNSYITGQNWGGEFPLQSPYSSTPNEIFVAKLNASGTALLYSTYLGGDWVDTPHAITVDAAGSAYVVGSAGASNGTPFPVTVGVLRTTVGGLFDAFIAKFDASGGLAASTLLGGSDSDIATRVAIDASNNVYVTGQTSSSDFPTTPGAFDRTYSGYNSSFVAKVNPTLTGLTYSTYLDNSAARALAINPAGEVYVAGMSSPGFPTTIGAYQVNCTSNFGFITKLASSGSALVYSSCFPGDPVGLDIDTAGNAYLLAPSLSGRVAVHKVNAAGSAVVYECNVDSTAVNGTVRGDLRVDAQGNVYAAATIYTRALVVRIDPGGSLASYRALAGVNSSAYALAIDSTGVAYVTGRADSPATEFVTTPGVFDTVHDGGSEVFVVKVDLSDTVTVPVTVNTNPAGLSMTVDNTNYTTVQNFNWLPNSTHSVAVQSPQPGPTDVRYYFGGWFGACCDATATFVPSLTLPNIVVAGFDAYYRLVLNAVPPNSGNINVGAASDEGYYRGGSAAFTAVGAPGWAFSSWGGEAGSSTSNPIVLDINKPLTVAANFAPCTATAASRIVTGPYGGGSYGIPVVASAHCAWRIEGGAAWLNLFSNQGVGSGTASYNTNSLPGYAPRTAQLNLGAASMTMIQKQPTAGWRESSGALRVSTRWAAGAPSWPAGFRGEAASTQTAEGDTITAARDASGGLWVGRFSPASQAWSGVTFVGGKVAGKPAITMGMNGVAYIAIRDEWNSYWVATFTPGVGPGAWIRLGGVLASDPSIAAGPTDSVYVVGRDQWNGVWSNRIVIGTGAQGWRFGGGIVQGKPAVTVGADNVAYIAARDAYNAVWMARVQQETWLGWQPAGGIVAADPQITATQQFVWVFSLDGSGNIWFAKWFHYNSSFQPWTQRWAALQDFSACPVGEEMFVAGRTRANSTVEWYGITDFTYANAGATASGPVECGPR